MFLETLIDLLQTVVDLEPKCCESLHVFLILGAYTATLSLSGEKVLSKLFRIYLKLPGFYYRGSDIVQIIVIVFTFEHFLTFLRSEITAAFVYI